jgi:hypothetical protein
LQVRLILLEETAAGFRVLGLGKGILQGSLFERIEGDDDAIDLGQRFEEVSFGISGS